MFADACHVCWAGELEDTPRHDGYLIVALKLQRTLRGQQQQQQKDGDSTADVAIFTHFNLYVEGQWCRQRALIYKRPFTDAFLTEVSRRYRSEGRIQVYTHGKQGYADRVCQVLDLDERHLRSGPWKLEFANPKRPTKRLAYVNAIAAASIIIDDCPMQKDGRCSSPWDIAADANQAILIDPYYGPCSTNGAGLRQVLERISELVPKVSFLCFH